MKRRIFLQGLFATGTSSLVAWTTGLWANHSHAEDVKAVAPAPSTTNTPTTPVTPAPTNSSATTVTTAPSTSPVIPTTTNSASTTAVAPASSAASVNTTAATTAPATPNASPVSGTALTGVPALDAANLDEAYKVMCMSPIPSKEITIKAPELAENGAIIPVHIATSIPDTQQILIVVPENPYPLAAAFFLHKGMEPMAYTRIRMTNDATILAIIKTTRESFVAKHAVKVAVSDCDV